MKIFGGISLVVCKLLFSVVAASAQLSDTFTARITLDVCPEISFGGVALDYFYTVGDNPAVNTPEIVSQTINTEDFTATVDLKLPSTFQDQKIKVSASCRNAVAFGPSSNILSVSNCDVLSGIDTDGDGIMNNLEDTNCDNFFSPGDTSNPDNVDTDGDGVRDLVETLQGFDPTNPGSSPRPFIYASGPFDADGDGDSNPLVWRGSNGIWFVRDFFVPDNHLSFLYGQTGDIPFTYNPEGGTTNVGVVRNINQQLTWLFRGTGFVRSNSSPENSLNFGLFGDNLIPGPWEASNATNPAIARLFNNSWTFVIYKSDGTFRTQNWGGNGDIPKVQDYDGDGLFDIAVFRPSEQKSFIIRSSDGDIQILNFGTGTADHTVRGDFTGDGTDDISFWEPLTGLFTTMKSDMGFDQTKAAAKDPDHYFELPLGLFGVHLPLNWNVKDGKLLYTVVDHATGTRYYRPDNDADSAPTGMQWGLPGDHQG